MNDSFYGEQKKNPKKSDRLINQNVIINFFSIFFLYQSFQIILDIKQAVYHLVEVMDQMHRKAVQVVVLHHHIMVVVMVLLPLYHQ